MLKKGYEFVIWGVGDRGQRLFDYCFNGGVKISAFIDSNPQLHGAIIKNCPVISFDEYRMASNQSIILVSPLLYQDIVNVLRIAGVERYLLYRDMILPTYDDIGDDKEDLFDDSFDGSKEWKIERNNLLYLFRKLNYFMLNRFWRMDLLQHEFNENHSVVMMDTLLKKVNEAKHPLVNTGDESVISATRFLCSNKIVIASGVLPYIEAEFDMLLVHGLHLDMRMHCLLIKAREYGAPVVFEEDGFLRSIVPYDFTNTDECFRRPHALILQENGIYINAMQPSYMERILESDWQLSEREFKRAKQCILRIRKERLSKYNHQPLLCDSLVYTDKETVLVIDQVYGDKSIEYGMAGDDTFSKMLESAMRDNPDAEIYVKTHPASNKGHYGYLRGEERVHLLSDPVNPIALLEQIDKVYVCVSTMGFEALICGCETHVFGMPFYAGWGLTNDKIKCERRTKKRSLEEVFYVAYVMASVYVSYETGARCEIEQAMDELISLRRIYFARNNLTE